MFSQRVWQYLLMWPITVLIVRLLPVDVANRRVDRDSRTAILGAEHIGGQDVVVVGYRLHLILATFG